MISERTRLKSYGKHGNASRKSATVYDGSGGWCVTQHHDQLRTLTNTLFDKYYGELQQLGCLLDDAPACTDDAEADRACRASDVVGEYDARACEAHAELWARELARFRIPLPTTFWINDTDPLAPSLRQYFESVDSSLIEPISWYPIPGMAWRILADKTEFRRRPELQALRQCLIEQTALGTISRQEEVSMIPTFLLQIQSHDVCLDMCASPGSKTAQMLVALGRQKIVPFSSPQSPFPFDYESDGLVVANELDTKRANMLVHQVKRMRLLFPFALFTNHDARYFPEIASCAAGSTVVGHTPDAPSAAAEPAVCVSEVNSPDGNVSSPRATIQSTPSTTVTPLRFDKILCDVVCSGDGTLRKAPHIFKIWSPYEAMSLQRTQIQIALRACHLLKVGGRLVYSTCSLNPIENEAVVTQIVHRTQGAMRLVDVRGELLPHLPCARGLQHWIVTDAQGRVCTRPTRVSSAVEAARERGEDANEERRETSAPAPASRCKAHAHAHDMKCYRVCDSEPHVEAEAEAECNSAVRASCAAACADGGAELGESIVPPASSAESQTREGDAHCDNKKGGRRKPRGGGHFIMHEALFPPHTPGGYRSAAVDALDLRRCIRLLPRHCNGGAFFIAVLDKVAEFHLPPPRRTHTADESVVDDACVTSEETKGGMAGGEVSDAPHTASRVTVPPQYVAAPESICAAVRDFYEIPSFPLRHLVVRTAHGERTLRLTPSSVCTFVSKTALHVLQHKTDALTVVSAGLRVLAYESLDKGWRVTSESALLFAKLMQNSSRFIRVPVSLVEQMIRDGGKLKEVALEDVADAELRARVEELSLGVCLLGIDMSRRSAPHEAQECAASEELFYSVALRARSRLQLFVDHEDLVGLQLRLGLTPPVSSTAPAVALPCPDTDASGAAV